MGQPLPKSGKGVIKLVKWDEAVKRALRAYLSRDRYCYLYGAKGKRISCRGDVLSFFLAEPGYFSRYSAEEKEQIIRNSLGKTAYDCSGFTGWLCTGDRQYSAGQLACATYRTADLASGIAGSLLYTSYGGTGRHVGIDMGYGFCLDMACESTDRNVAEGRDSVRLYPIHSGEVPWEVSFCDCCVDYTGATAV